MSHFTNLFNYSWSSTIDGTRIEIKAVGRDVEEARREVLAILDDIVRIKPEYQVLKKEFDDYVAAKMKKNKTSIVLVPLFSPKSQNVPKTRAQVAKAKKKPRDYSDIREDQLALLDKIPADFFSGSDSVRTFDYTPDRVVGDGKKTLAEFIRTTKPKCEGPAYMVSFSSCLDG